MKYLIQILTLVLMPVSSFSATINTVHVNEKNIIHIDGANDDWERFNVDTLTLHPAQYTDSASVSCTAMSMSDIDNVYFFFDVTDESIVYGEEMYGNAFWDDAVMVLFPQTRLNLPRQMIWVTGNDTGSIIEYHDNSGYYYPSLWEALGVTASYNINETGYTVELSIPHALLEETIEDNAISTLFETGVCDDDDGEDYESVLMMTGNFWGISSMEFSTFRYELISSDTSGLIVNNTLDDKQKNIHSILYDISDNNLLSAIKKTREIDSSWSLSMQAFLCSKYGYSDESIETYEKVLAEIDDPRVQWWALFRISELYRLSGDIDTLAKLYHDNRDCTNWIMGGFAKVGDMQQLSRKTKPIITNEIYDYCEKHLNPIMIKDLGIIGDARTWDVDSSTSTFYEMALSKSTKSWVTADILQLLIKFYTKIEDYENAEKCIEKNIDAFGINDLKAIADVYYHIKKYDTALEYYDQAFNNNPNTDIIRKSCDCYLKNNELDEAVSYFTEKYALANNANSKAMLKTLFADCLRTNSFYTEAMALYEDVVDDEIIAFIKERAILGIADIYLSQGEFVKLENYVEKIKNSNCSAHTKFQADIYLSSMLDKSTN